jgi:hypothetical protein
MIEQIIAHAFLHDFVRNVNNICYDHVHPNNKHCDTHQTSETRRQQQLTFRIQLSYVLVSPNGMLCKRPKVSGAGSGCTDSRAETHGPNVLARTKFLQITLVARGSVITDWILEIKIFSKSCTHYG